MQWGGAEEQAKEREAGNMNAVNWQDEAMRIVERTMQDYWEEAEEDAADGKAPVSRAPLSSVNTESEFDRHRRLLIAKARRDGTAASHLGWPTELRRYLEDMPSDVSKHMIVVKWWSVGDAIYVDDYLLINYLGPCR